MLRNIAILLSVTTIIAAPLAAQTAMKEDPAFTAKLRATLEAHPEMILEYGQKGQERLRAQARAAQERKVADLRPTLMARQPFGPVIGNPQASKTIVELLDYACPFCKRAHDGVDAIADGDKDVRFVIVMRPVLGPESETLARFALAADLQGRFRQAHDALYAKFGDDHQTHATDANLQEVATAAGVDFARAKRDMTGDAVERKLASHNGIAEQMGVSGTPFFLLPDSVIPGYATEAQLRAALASK